MNTMKRIISTLLAVIMLLGSFAVFSTVGVSAASDDIDKVIQDEEHTKNVNAIIETISKYDEVDIWVAFGNHIYGRTYMSYCLKDIYKKLLGIKINWLSIGVNKSGAPKHPLYQKSTSQLVSFDMNAYINTLK